MKESDNIKKCEHWEEKYQFISWYDTYAPNLSDKPIQICKGTKECKNCSCNGDVTKCDFYPEKRKENNIMNTAEMWIKAQEDGMCYETIEQGPDAFTLYYQKDKGLFDDDGVRCGPEIWNYFDDLMNEQWRLRTMTKSEAEAKFNIKIVGE